MSSISLRDAADEYIRTLRANGTPVNTERQYRRHVLRLVDRYPSRKFGTLTAPEIAQHLYGPTGVIGTSQGTTTRSALRSFFRYGSAMGWSKYLIDVPGPIITSKKVKAGNKNPTRLTAPQLLLMLEKAEGNPMLWAMVAVAMNTALRSSDVLKIELQHVNLLTGELYVDIQKTGVFDAMPITLDLDDILRRYLTWYAAETGVDIRDHGKYLFPRYVPDREASDFAAPVKRLDASAGHLNYETARRWLHDLFEACGIETKAGEGWHVIRRSVARIYFDQMRADISFDHALRQTAALLAHKNTETTERYLGLQAEIAARNESLRGKPFLTAVGGRGNNVVALTR